MEAPNTKSATPFLTLPAELRNKIYRLALIRGTFCVYTCACRPWSTVLNLYCASQLPLGLLRASRQVHLEAASILYVENNFAFPDPIRCTRDFQGWLEQIGPDSCKLLRKVNISPPITEFQNEIFVAFVECSRLLEGAADLELPLNTPNIRSGSMADLALHERGNCKKIVIRRVGRTMEMAWMELSSLQTDPDKFQVHDA
jgi:hypothetical protein